MAQSSSTAASRFVWLFRSYFTTATATTTTVASAASTTTTACCGVITSSRRGFSRMSKLKSKSLPAPSKGEPQPLPAQGGQTASQQALPQEDETNNTIVLPASPGKEITGANNQSELEEDLQTQGSVVESLFSTRRPKDGWAGLSSGLKSVAKGVGAGVAVLIAAPIAGAQQDGVKGLFTGLASGVASAVALPVTGVCIGAYQIGRGLINSGEAYTKAQAGMIWDDQKREWIFYTLEHEREELNEAFLKHQQQQNIHGCKNGSANGTSTAGERKVKDRTYYDLLGVSTNANAQELKRAYYKQARHVHPDRNKNDPAAAQKFQQLSQAYQILSSDHMRAAYDKHGKPEANNQAAAEMQLSDIDPYVFFAVMFGSDQVRPYIGELWIANKADSIMKDPFFMKDMDATSDAETSDKEDNDEDEDEEEKAASLRKEEAKLKQRKRVVDCALNLRARVQPFQDGTVDEATFVALCQEEAATVTKGGCFGDIFCCLIGYALEMEATEFIGTHGSFLGYEGRMTSLRKRQYNMSTQIKILGAGISAARAGTRAFKDLNRLTDEHVKASGGDEEVAASSMDAPENRDRYRQATEKIEESLPVFFDLAWAINRQDITRTLRDVCQKLFDDGAETLSLDIRLKRAEGVRLLGREFYSMGKIASKTTVQVDAHEIRRRAEIAAMKTLAHAQGQEISDKDAEEMLRQARS